MPVSTLSSTFNQNSPLGASFVLEQCYIGRMVGEQEFEYLPFGEALKRRRQMRGLSQEAVAAAMKVRGFDVGQTAVSKWERRADPIRDAHLLENLADVLRCSPEDLLDGRVPVRRRSLVRSTPVVPVAPQTNRAAAATTKLAAIGQVDEAAAEQLYGMIDELHRLIVERGQAEREAIRRRQNSGPGGQGDSATPPPEAQSPGAGAPDAGD